MSDVLIRTAGACGRITLNRPKALNALTLAMVSEMETALLAWAADASVHFILVDGAGERGLCAGGDIRAMYNASVNGTPQDSSAFFHAEYRLNYLISRYPKPYIALMDRLVMGGGIGISAHGSHRVVTERSELGMPETSIGFFPDIGGTYLLGRAPGELGTYLGLTGRRAGAADALRSNLADYVVPGERLPELTDAIERCANATDVNDCLHSFQTIAPTGMPSEQSAWISTCFAHPTVEKIMAALRAHDHPEAAVVVRELETKSPTSLKMTLLAIRRAPALGSLAACLQQEFHLAQAMVREHDFVEGVRAAIVDKDRNPKWLPATLQEVTPELTSRLLPATIPAALDLSYPGLSNGYRANDSQREASTHQERQT